MPQAVLKFVLPDEQAAYSDAVRGDDWHSAVTGLDEFLRSKLKYGDEPMRVKAGLELARTQLHQILTELDLKLYE